MSPFRYNEHRDHFEARDGSHSISIADHVWMTEFERLQNEKGMLSDEAFNTLDRVSWWYEQLPMSGVFIDGMELVISAKSEQVLRSRVSNRREE